MPTYIHCLGAVVAIIGLWISTFTGVGWLHIVTHGGLNVVILAGLVYVSFGYYGSAIMQQRQKKDRGSNN